MEKSTVPPNKIDGRDRARPTRRSKRKVQVISSMFIDLLSQKRKGGGETSKLLLCRFE